MPFNSPLVGAVTDCLRCGRESGARSPTESQARGRGWGWAPMWQWSWEETGLQVTCFQPCSVESWPSTSEVAQEQLAAGDVFSGPTGRTACWERKSWKLWREKAFASPLCLWEMVYWRLPCDLMPLVRRCPVIYSPKGQMLESLSLFIYFFNIEVSQPALWCSGGWKGSCVSRWAHTYLINQCWSVVQLLSHV